MGATVALRHIAATFSAADKCGLAAMLTDLATELDQHGRRDSKLHWSGGAWGLASSLACCPWSPWSGEGHGGSADSHRVRTRLGPLSVGPCRVPNSPRI